MSWLSIEFMTQTIIIDQICYDSLLEVQLDILVGRTGL